MGPFLVLWPGDGEFDSEAYGSREEAERNVEGGGIVVSIREAALAPEMLEALRGARDWMDGDGCDCGTDEPGTCALCRARSLLDRLDQGG